jgi:FtsZ-binding cell division protein ZapB
VKCNGVCEKVFHAKCVKEDVANKKTRSAWRCKDCKPLSQSSVKSSSSGNTAITKEFFKCVLEDFKREVFQELKTFRKEMGELKTSAQFLNETVETNNSLMNLLKDEFATLKKQNEQLLASNSAMKKEMGALQDRVRALEQYTRRNNVEVSGIPVTSGEKVVDIIKDVGVSLGVPIDEGDIAAAHRIPSYKKENVPSIVVQFQRRAVRDSWIAAFKNKRTLTASEVNRIFPSQKVWVNEHLSPENKLFLARLKKKCREIGFKYAWCRDGRFYARKSDGEKYHRIMNENDVEKLK